MLVPSFIVTTLLALEGAEAIAYTNRGGAQKFLGPRGIKYLNTGLPMPLVGFKHAVLASKWPQTHAVGCTSSGISFQFTSLSVKFSVLLSTSVFLKMNTSPLCTT